VGTGREGGGGGWGLLLEWKTSTQSFGVKLTHRS